MKPLLVWQTERVSILFTLMSKYKLLMPDCKYFAGNASDSVTSPRKLKISPKGTDFKHKEFRIKENSDYIFYKKGAFFTGKNTLP